MTYLAVLYLVMHLIVLPLVVLARFPFVLAVLLLVMGALAVLCCVTFGSIAFFNNKRFWALSNDNEGWFAAGVADITGFLGILI